MKQTKRKESAGRNPGNAGAFDFSLAFVSLCALALTFSLSQVDYEYETKLLIFSAIAGVYAAFCIFSFLRRRMREISLAAEKIEKEREAFVESRLFALEEANAFFGAALKPADILRLVSSRIEELISFNACAFYVAEDGSETLKIAFACGTNAQMLNGLKINSEKGVAGSAFTNGKSLVDKKLTLDKLVFAPDAIKDFQTAIAAPLFQNGKIIGVLQLFSADINAYDENAARLLEAVCEKTAPLFAGSIAFERNLSSALTDSLTALPNERAFYTVLENQIAESTRFQSDRPLTILCLDIDNFSEFNRKFGHSTGDGFLSFTGENIKNQLRRMDFLARSSGDEFLVVLPTANERVAREIVERITISFGAKPFAASANEKIYVKLNFGSATFGRDGETAARLVKTAISRKRQSKSAESGKVLRFPKEYVN